MRDFDENNITAAVIDRFADTPDPRLKEIMSSLVRHLHAFACDVRLSFAEWSYPIDFLTRTGQICSDKRQEFILLSDTLGLSMLVDAIDHLAPVLPNPRCSARSMSRARPRCRFGPTCREGCAASRSMSKAPFVRPLDDRLQMRWSIPGIRMMRGSTTCSVRSFQRRRCGGDFAPTRTAGFIFWSIVPKFYPIPDDGPVGEMLAATARHPFRPAHVHFMISAPRHETLITHVFAADSPYLDSDAVFGVKERWFASLLARHRERGRMGKQSISPGGSFPIVLRLRDQAQRSNNMAWRKAQSQELAPAEGVSHG
jgi:Catechol dioxygenase N terminus/Dioxygenase